MSGATGTVIWIVSYPKSGNTWVRFLLCNLFFGPQESAAALSRLAPDIHEFATIPEPPAAHTFIKTHYPFSPELPLASHTAAAIYVVREPADVMLSNFHYSRRSGVATTDSSAALGQYVEEYLTARGDPRWIQARMGSWDEHVRSWLGVQHPFPVLPVRYEDLLADGHGGARRICAFLGLTRTEQEIAQAVAGASFRRMQEIEEADIRNENIGIFYKPYLRQSIDTGRRFMRSGKAGEAALVLSPEQRRRATAVFEPLMRELGYSG